ncbi:lysozyme inhibitor LprI family protein [Xanthomonas sp. NCPPB 1638]|uniref:lysozyme inhibitor LprI family protein n=1 Tax=Xanthomonas sp. NCPPB 1638 TaxID=487535 RepID=UPI0035570809
MPKSLIASVVGLLQSDDKFLIILPLGRDLMIAYLKVKIIIISVILSTALLCACSRQADFEDSHVNSIPPQVHGQDETSIKLSDEIEIKRDQVAREQDRLLDQVLDGEIQRKREEIAKSVQLRPTYGRCIKESNAIHPAIMACNESEYEYHDARLNKAYRNLMGRLAVGEKAALKQEERDWIKQRDALCQSNGALGGGQAEELEDSSCMLNATAKRADDLEKR